MKKSKKRNPKDYGKYDLRGIYRRLDYLEKITGRILDQLLVLWKFADKLSK